MDLIIRNAKLLTGNIADIGIKEGYIVSLNTLSDPSLSESPLSVSAPNSINVNGMLVTPALIDPHIHLDKVNILDVVRPNHSGTLSEAIEIIWEKKKTYTVTDIVDRASTVIEKAIKNGTLFMRTHVDVDTKGGLKPLEGVLALRDKYKHVIDIQIVAFPQEGIIKDPGCDALMVKAMEMGANIVGGMPANEKTPENSKKHVQFVFELASKFDADVDMHVDETDDPFYRTLEMVADETLRTGWQERVTAGHTCALAAYDDHYAAYVMDKVKKAKIHMITNPVTNLMLQGRGDKQPIRRGITRVKELLDRNILVSFGQDCVRDTFYPFGSADMMQIALITAHAAQMSLPHERTKLMEMITTDAAKILKLENYGLEVGCKANLVVFNTNSLDDAIGTQAERSYVIRNGRIVSKTITETIQTLE